MSYWVWVFGEIDALRWVADQGLMAFPDNAARRIRPMKAGDHAILYTTRGAFHNPTRDEARLVGLATVTADPERAQEPVEIAGREFPLVCRIEVDLLLPERTGPSVRDVAPTLALVRKPESWGAYFRQPPVRVGEGDFERMRKAIRTMAARG